MYTCTCITTWVVILGSDVGPRQRLINLQCIFQAGRMRQKTLFSMRKRNGKENLAFHLSYSLTERVRCKTIAYFSTAGCFKECSTERGGLEKKSFKI